MDVILVYSMGLVIWISNMVSQANAEIQAELEKGD